MAGAWGFALLGVQAMPVRVEAHVRPGLPGATVVGLPGTAVREAKERIRSAAASSGVPLPTQRITVNLSPGDLRKDGPGLDLPVALSVLAASGYIAEEALTDVAAYGELALTGEVRPVRGLLSVAEAAVAGDHTLLLVPVSGLVEASCVGDAPVVGVRTLQEALAVVSRPAVRRRLAERGLRWTARHRRNGSESRAHSRSGDFAEVVGQAFAKRALEIAAAGSHHVLLHGPPGGGKTMLARRFPSIMPALTETESLEVTRIWSAAGLRDPELGLVRERPFRAPHHTATRAALVGGGGVPRPGEVSLAHRGVLFLDELPEFSRDALESLRQPLEEGEIILSRQGVNCWFPAQVTLIAAMNPCPCGFLGSTVRPCRCSDTRREGYASRASGPLLDRIDVRVEVSLPRFASSLQAVQEGSAAVAARVAAAHRFRREREETRRARGLAPSAHPQGFALWVGLHAHGEKTLLRAMSAGLGGRGYVRTLRVARTIADLDGSPSVREEHVLEALSLRGEGVRAA